MGDVTKAEMQVDCFVLPAAAGCADGISKAATEEGAPEGCEAVSWRSSCLTGSACCWYTLARSMQKTIQIRDTISFGNPVEFQCLERLRAFNLTPVRGYIINVEDAHLNGC